MIAGTLWLLIAILFIIFIILIADAIKTARNNDRPSTVDNSGALNWRGIYRPIRKDRYDVGS